jgi:predicted aspartyl protease
LSGAVAAVLVIVGISACGGSEREKVARNKPIEMPFRLVDNRIVLTAIVNGKPLPLLLDTGGQTLVSDRVVRALELKPTRRAKGNSRSVALSSVQLGGFRKTDVRTTVARLDPPVACASANGVLGADFFKDAELQIDFGASRIRLAADGGHLKTSGAPRVSFRPASGEVPTPQVPSVLGRVKHSLDLDTGSQHYLLLDPAVARAAGARTGADALTFTAEPIPTIDDTQKGTLAFGGLSRLRLDGVTRSEVVASAGTASDNVNSVGIEFLRDFAVTIDWTRSNVSLVPQGSSGNGTLRTYGYLPKLSGREVIVGALMQDGPAAAAGMKVGDALTRVATRSLDHPSGRDFCSVYSEAFEPTGDLQRVSFRHTGESRVAELAAVRIGPGRLASKPAPVEQPPSPPTGEHTLLVDGDSLAIGARPYLEDLLRGWRITHSASIGRPTADGIAALRRYDSLPHVLVMSLGTNDDSRATEEFRAAIRQTLEIAGRGRCVVWPNIVRPPFRGVSYDGFNVVLSDEAKRSSNLIVIDWAAIVRDHPDWRTPDQVHLTPAGYQARAQEIATAVSRCG